MHDIITRFEGVKQTGQGKYQVKCPAHKDNRASLTITKADDKILLYCHAGCELENILRATGLTTKDLFLDNDINYQVVNNKPTRQIEKVYQYKDLEGNVIHEKVRYTNKSFMNRQVKDGQTIWNMKGVTPLLYNLSNLVKAIEQGETVYIVEGEKDSDTLNSLGLTSTCNYEGAGKGKFKKHYVKYFTNADVVVIQDNDPAGKESTKTIVNLLIDVVKSIKAIDLNQISKAKGFDITDYFNIGYTKDEFLKLVEETKKIQKKSVGKVDNPNDTEQRSVFNSNGCYCKYTSNGLKNISNFIISLKEIIVNGADTHVKADFTGRNGYKTEKVFNINSFNSKKNFLEVANDIQFSFTGSDLDLQELKQIMAIQEYRSLLGVDCIGFNKINNSKVFITNTQAINQELNPIDDVVITDEKTVIKSNILEVEPITKEELKSISLYLFTFNKLEITTSILGTMSVMMIKERLKDLNIKTQHLFIFGEAGSGKSQTLENIIVPFFSYDSPILSCTGITEFTAIKNISSSNTIPLMLEEYKPSEMNDRQKNMLLGFFRDIYDEHSKQRGNRNQTITDYPLLSPIVAVGEEQIEQTAVIERSIIVSYSKLESEKNNREDKFLKLKANRKLIQKLGRSILNIALQIDDQELKEYIEKSRTYTRSVFKGRVRQNVINTIVGLHIIAKLYHQLGLNMEEETKVKVKDMITAINNNVFIENLEETRSTKTITDSTLELIDTMAGRGILVEGVHYTYVNSKTELALSVNSFFDDVTKYKSDFKVETNIVTTQRQFTKMLRNTDYYVDYRAVRYADEDNPNKTKVIKSYVLSIDKLKERKLDMENLLSI